MKLRIVSTMTALLLLAAPLHAASLTFDFTSSLFTAFPGQTVAFSGTVTNTGATTVFLNGDSFSFALPLDDNPFLLNFPLSLAPSASFTGTVFQVTIPLLTSAGLYSGVFNILGGDSAAASEVLASKNFGVQVQSAAVPEPTPWALTLAGLLVVLWRRKSRSPLSNGRALAKSLSKRIE
jgi:hypothetical protein